MDGAVGASPNAVDRAANNQLLIEQQEGAGWHLDEAVGSGGRSGEAQVQLGSADIADRESFAVGVGGQDRHAGGAAGHAGGGWRASGDASRDRVARVILDLDAISRNAQRGAADVNF